MACHHAADARGKSEHVGDGGGVQQLVLEQEKKSRHIRTTASPLAWNESVTSPWRVILTVGSSEKLESGVAWGLGFRSVADEWVHVCVMSYRNFLLRDHNDGVGAPDPHSRQPALRDGFKGIFCKKEGEKSGFKIGPIRINLCYWL